MRKAKYLTKKLIEWLRSHEDEPSENDSVTRDDNPQVKTYIYSSHVSAGGWME